MTLGFKRIYLRNIKSLLIVTIARFPTYLKVSLLGRSPYGTVFQFSCFPAERRPKAVTSIYVIKCHSFTDRSANGNAILTKNQSSEKSVLHIERFNQRLVTPEHDNFPIKKLLSMMNYKNRKDFIKILIGQGVSSVGDGLWLSIWAIYLTQILHIPVITMSVIVAVSGIFGIVFSYPSGVAADRYSARNVLFLLTLIRGGGMAGLCFENGPASLTVCTFLLFGTQSAAAGVRNALVCGIFDNDKQINVLSTTSVVQHIGYAVGSAFGAIVLGVNNFTLFTSAFSFSAFCLFLYSIIIMLIPKDEPGSKDIHKNPKTALTNYPFLVVMAITAIFALCWAIMSTALPLWCREFTSAPFYLPGLILSGSSLVISACQVRVTRDMVSSYQGARASLWAGLFLAIGCVFFIFSQMGGILVASAFIVIASIISVIGELYFVGSRWVLSLRLMDESQKGRYQGIAASFEAIIMAIGPALVSIVVLLPYGVGWMIFAFLFALAGFCTPPLVRWAEDSRSIISLDASADTLHSASIES